jgi:hypothetical protein
MVIEVDGGHNEWRGGIAEACDGLYHSFQKIDFSQEEVEVISACGDVVGGLIGEGSDVSVVECSLSGGNFGLVDDRDGLLLFLEFTDSLTFLIVLFHVLQFRLVVQHLSGQFFLLQNQLLYLCLAAHGFFGLPFLSLNFSDDSHEQVWVVVESLQYWVADGLAFEFLVILFQFVYFVRHFDEFVLQQFQFSFLFEVAVL